MVSANMRAAVAIVLLGLLITLASVVPLGPVEVVLLIVLLTAWAVFVVLWVVRPNKAK